MLKIKDYDFLISSYRRVDTYLKGDQDLAVFSEVIVSFCVCVEKIIKIILHKKNPALVFDANKITDSTILAIILKKEESINTSHMFEVINRFNKVKKTIFTDGEVGALQDIYKARSHFMHSYKKDLHTSSEKEDLIKKMGSLWGKISDLIVKEFGKDNLKKHAPAKKYTESELKNIFKEEVRELINYRSYRSTPTSLIETTLTTPLSPLGLGFVMCPRCQKNTLSKNEESFIGVYEKLNTLDYIESGNLYKCKNCNLELTENQYKIAKEIFWEQNKIHLDDSF